jgi:hypothetical protein
MIMRDIKEEKYNKAYKIKAIRITNIFQVIRSIRCCIDFRMGRCIFDKDLT